MRTLIDSRVFLWAITDDRRLSITHRAMYVDPNRQLYLSTASIWEILIKAGLGKLALPAPATAYLTKQMEKNRVIPLAVHLNHLAELELLPPLHRDPFDRMLVAQARAEKMSVMTENEQVRQYGVEAL